MTSINMTRKYMSIYFFTTKETIRKIKRQPSKWKKIFANKATDKGLIYKIYKKAYAAQYQKNKQPNLKNGQKT